MTNHIFIQKESQINFQTWLNNPGQDLVGTIELLEEYMPLRNYLGSVGYINAEKYPHLIEQFGIKSGLIQNLFYPLGGNPDPALTGKGYAKKIELLISLELSKNFNPDTMIVIAANSESHLKYCDRVGITPNIPLELNEYIMKLKKD
ncbi:Uncharacterised protein [uncultured archaeon]|nr:Uncharacterised protein [uncultured archaeon]